MARLDSSARDFEEKQNRAQKEHRRTTLQLDTQGGFLGALADDPFAPAKFLASNAAEAGDITRDIFSGIFGEGGTDFGSIATDLLGKIEGSSDKERELAFQGIDEQAGQATANLSNRLGAFGNTDPEQFTRVAGDIDVGRLKARGETEAGFARMDRETQLSILRTLPGLMSAQGQQQSDFGGVAMNILKSAPMISTGSPQGFNTKSTGSAF